MIRYRNGAYEVVIHIGPHPVTEKPRRVSRTLRMREQKRTPKAVLDLEAKLRTEVAQGKHGSPDMTVGELLDVWLAHARADLSPTTVVGYDKSIRLHLKPTLGKVKLAKLSVSHLDRLYRSLLASGGVEGKPLSPATVRLAHAAIRRALHHAERSEWVIRNVAAIADPPSVKKHASRTPTPQELEKLIVSADRDLADLIALAAGMGLRRGEACGLRWSDLRGRVAVVQRNAIEISHKVTVKDTKSGKARRVPLGPNLVARLEDRREYMDERAETFGVPFDDGYVLSDAPDGQTPLHPNLASDRFRRHARKEGIGVRLHDLRHAKATYAIEAGIPATDVAEAMGWSSTKMLFDTYGHHTPAHLDKLAAVNDF